MFVSESFSFLRNLELNNNKGWFEENRHIYQSHIIAPIKRLIDDLDLFVISEIDENLETKPTVNKAISRIYRDTRFSQNKLPFKNHIGFNFRKKSPNWKYHPSFFFRISPDGYAFGMGVMKNNPDYFADFRQKIDFNLQKFAEIIKPIVDENGGRYFDILGENYKKYHFKIDQQKKKTKEISDKLLINIKKLYCKKNIFIRICADRQFYDSHQELAIDIEDKFRKLSGLYKFLK